MALDDEPNVPMTPREYVEGLVLPTLHEFLAARDDRRRAYLACLVVCHVADSIGLAELAREPGFEGLRGRPRRNAINTATKAAQTEAERRCGDVAKIVRDIANGTKHPSRLPLLPGSERHVPAFSFGVSGAGFGEGRWSVPGLAIDKGGEVLFLDACAQQVLAAFICAYPAHLGGIALAFMDHNLPVLGLDMSQGALTSISGWAGSKTELAEVWLLGNRSGGTSQPESEVALGVVLAALGAGQQGMPPRDWAQESWLASKGMWLEQLRPNVGGRLRVEVFSRPGEPRSTEEVASRVTAILLWTRAYLTTADLASLSAR